MQEDYSTVKLCTKWVVHNALTRFIFFTTPPGGLSPKSWGGHVLVTSYSFCILIVVASYTASLASLLTVFNFALSLSLALVALS